MSMLSILVKDTKGDCIPVLTEQSLDDIVMSLYKQKGWNIIEVTNNSGSFNYEVKNGVILKPSDEA